MARFRLCFPLLIVMVVCACGPVAAAPRLKHLVQTFVSKGKSIDRIVVPGRPPAFRMPAVKLPKPDRARGVNVLSNVPALEWCFGCAATSAAMMFGYYDNAGFPGMYTGPTNGGVFPLTNSAWPNVTISGETLSQCPLSATRDGVDGRSGRGAVDDYWIQYGSTSVDPWITNAWTQHTWGDCTGDFMGTNQSAWGNSDGSTTFYNYTDGSPLYDYTDCEASSSKDGCHGLKAFAESRGATVLSNFSQYIDAVSALGFTFAQYKAEIDAGRPVMIQVDGHSMLGVGYNDATNTVYLHDTWDWSSHDMTWGGSYAGMAHYGVAVVQLSNVSAPQIGVSVNGGASTTASLDVTLTLTNTGGGVPSEMRFANDSGGSPGSWSAWEPWTTSKAWSMAAGANGSRAVWAEARNGYGSSSQVADAISYAAVEPTRQWTVMVYLDADNNLEPFGIADFNEMEQVGSTDQVNVLVQMDRIPGYDSSNGDWTGCRRYRVAQDSNTSTISSPMVQDLGEVNMGHPDTLQDFISWGMTQYPAERYALVFWDHGGGWRQRNLKGSKAPLRGDGSKAVCWDDSSGGDCLYTKEWAGVIAGASSPLALVGFDVCLGGMIEPAYELWATGKASAMAASPPNEPGDGWPYNTILADLVATPGMTGLQLADRVVVRYGAYYGTNSVAMASYDLTQMPTLLGSLNSLLTTIISQNVEWSAVDAARQNALAYDTNYRDIRAFVEAVRDTVSNGAIQTAAAAAAADFGDFVHSYGGGGAFAGGRGISASFPATGPESQYTAANIEWVNASQWDEFLLALSTADRTAPAAPVMSPIDNADGDGNYGLGWSAVSDVSGIVQYRVAEYAAGDGPLLQDGAEDLSSPWTLSNFTRSTARYHDGSYSYRSGHANSYLATMTSGPLVIPPGVSANLNYWTWFQTEANWDYGYVRASSNGGSSWTTLKIHHGSSGSWVNYGVDLSAYAGSTILLRFSYETDSSLGYEGIYYDDITVTCLSPSGGTWTVSGATLSLALVDRPVGRWAYGVVAADGAGNVSGVSNLVETTVNPVNSPPSAPATVAATPANPRTGSTLRASASGSTDPDDDPVTYLYRWCKRVPGGDWSDWEYTGATVAPDQTAKGEEWKARARASAGGQLSGWTESAPLTVGNTPPSVPTATRCAPSSPCTTNDLTGVATGAGDADGDALTYVYQWRRSADEGQTWTTWGKQGRILSCDETTRGDWWQFRARARDTDGTCSGWLESEPIIVRNAKPTTPTTVAISPPSPTGKQNLAGVAEGSTDADGDSLNYVYQWSKSTNGGDTWTAWGDRGRVLSSDLTAPGEMWRVRARANDGPSASGWRIGEPVTITLPALALVKLQGAATTIRGSEMQIVLQLNTAACVEGQLCNLAGRPVASLPPRTLPAGQSTLVWQARTASGTRLPGGTYLLRLVARDTSGNQSASLMNVRW